MTVGRGGRRIFHPNLSTYTALGLAGILLAACEREQRTSQEQAQEQVTCETTSHVISKKMELPAGTFTMGSYAFHMLMGCFLSFALDAAHKVVYQCIDAN